MTVRIVKWAEDAEKFLESAKEDSLELDVVISYSCASQTGFGFEDLVNSINSPEIRKKVKKVEIVDSSYLYRHCIPEFSWYADTSVPTLWYLKNKDYIDRLEVDTTVSSWAAKINNDEFKRWHKRVRTDFFGEADGSGLNRTFRELVIRDAAVAAYKGKWNFENCVDFILEECAYICTYFKKSISVYPMRFYDSMSNIAKRYGLDITHLAYKTSSYSRKREVHDSKIKEGIIDLLAEKLDANFFVINKYGEYLYRNGALINVVGTIPPDTLKESWKASMLVMQSQKQSVIEEKYNDKVFLSIKAPLEIGGNVEGVMGVSIDITDRKKALADKEDRHQHRSNGIYPAWKEHCSPDKRHQQPALLL